MTWVTEHQARLKNMRAELNGHETSLDIARRLQQSSTSSLYQKGGSGVGNEAGGTTNNDKSFWDSLGTGGKSFLDFISRPMYATLGATSSALKAHKKDPFSAPGAYAEGFWKGISGQEKILTSDILKENVSEYKDWNPAAKFAVGFGGDVLADPLTYVPGAVFVGAGKKIFQGIQKVTGKSEHALKGRATNPLTISPVESAPPVLPPKAFVKKSVEETGQAKVRVEDAPTFTKHLENLANRNPDKPVPFRVVDTPSGPPDRFWTPAETDASKADRAIVEATRATLSKIPTRRYPADVKIDDIYTRAAASVPDEAVGNASKKAPELPNPENVLNDIINEHISKFRTTKSGNITTYLPDGSSSNISRANLIGLISSKVKSNINFQDADEIAWSIDDLRNGVKLSAEKALKDLNKASKLTADSAKIAEEALPLTRADMKKWIADHPHLSPEDSLHIRKANNAKRAAAAIEFVRNKMVPGGIHTLDDLEAAIKNKTIDKNAPEIQAILNEILTATKTSDVAKALKAAREAEKRNIRNRQWSTGGPQRLEREVSPKNKKVAEAKTVKERLIAYAEAGTRKPPVKYESTADYKARVAAELKAFENQNVQLDPELVMQKLRQRVEPLISNPIADRVAAQVSPPGSLVEAVLAHQNTAAFKREKIILDQAQSDGVQRVVQKITREQLIDPKDASKYPYRTNRNVPRTESVPIKGKGKFPAVNKRAQMEIASGLLNEALKLVPKTLHGPAREVALYNKMMPMLHAAEQMMRQSGIPIILNTKGTGIPLSLHDVLSALRPDVVQNFIFNAGKSIDWTQITEITQQLVMLSNKTITPAQFDATTHALLKARRGGRQADAAYAATKAATFSRFTAASFKATDKGAADIARVAEAFKDAAPEIMQALSRNSAEQLIKVGEHTKQISDAAINLFAKAILKDNVTPSDIIGVVTNPARLIKEAAEGVENAAPEAINLARVQLELRMADMVDSPTITATAKGAEAYDRAITQKILRGERLNPNDKAVIAAELMRNSEERARGLMKELGVPTFDLGLTAEYMYGVEYLRNIAPHLGVADLRKLLNIDRGVAFTDSMRYALHIDKVAGSFTKEQLVTAFRSMQLGEPVTDPAALQVFTSLTEVWNKVLGDSGKFGFLGRNGFTFEELDRAFRHFGVSEKYKLDKNVLSESWKNWDVTDPLDLASKINAAANMVLAEHAIGARFTTTFGKKELLEGYVKLGNTPNIKGETSRIGDLVDRNLYYPEAIARQMPVIDNILAEYVKPAKNNKALRLLDSVMHSWKAGMTIYRPGHHMRNEIGDIILGQMDGMYSIRYYRNAWKVMNTRKDNYKSFDAMDALRSSGTSSYDPNGAILSLKYKGKKVHWTPNEIYKLAYQNNMLKSYNIIEDTNFSPGMLEDPAAKLRSKSPFKGKVHKVAAGVSEYRDHHIRLAHFMYAMEKHGLDSKLPLEDAIKLAGQSAAARVTKWHPDGADLSEFERAFGRRAIPFYSWIRKAIPLVIESALVHPGRFLQYPKATYNIAEAQGIDLESIGNQFPADQLFPSWMQDGTQGVIAGSPYKYWGAKPGNPNLDVLDQYFTNPQQTMQTTASSVNPAIRAFFELSSRHSAGTGAPIKDISEYVDAQLPFASTYNKITGKSMSSGPFLQDLKVAPANVGYTPDIPVWLNALINHNSGVGIQDMSKPSYIKQGQFAERDRYRQNPGN